MDNLDNVTDLYNIIATLCQYIVGSNNKNYLVQYNCSNHCNIPGELKNCKMSARAQMFCYIWVYGELDINKLVDEFE